MFSEGEKLGLRAVRSIIPIVGWVALWMLESTVVLANNGAFLFSSAVNQIEIDGQFEDWPKSLPRQTISAVRFGRYLEGPEDALVHFRMAHSVEANCLYLAVEFYDDSFTKTEAPWVVEADGFEIG